MHSDMELPERTRNQSPSRTMPNSDATNFSTISTNRHHIATAANPQRRRHLENDFMNIASPRHCLRA